jgi:hypothetical protein
MEERQLFGGAVLAALPVGFKARPRRHGACQHANTLTRRRIAQDMSAIRDVPDSQELWVDEASDVSLIVEFVEHLPHVAVRRSLAASCVMAGARLTRANRRTTAARASSGPTWRA